MEALALVAEVAVGLAGFAGVAVMLGRGPGRWTDSDAARIRLLFGAAFGALFASLVPVGLASSGVRERLCLQLGAAAALVAMACWALVATRSLARLPAEERIVFDPRIAHVLRSISIATMIALLLAATGLVGRATAGVVFFALYAMLGYAAFGFVRLLFVRPASDVAEGSTAASGKVAADRSNREGPWPPSTS